jgi:hypothetical protein
MGAVDRYLSQEGRLTLIESIRDVRAKIAPVRRVKTQSDLQNLAPLQEILAAAQDLLGSGTSPAPNLIRAVGEPSPRAVERKPAL